MFVFSRGGAYASLGSPAPLPVAPAAEFASPRPPVTLVSAGVVFDILRCSISAFGCSAEARFTYDDLLASTLHHLRLLMELAVTTRDKRDLIRALARILALQLPR